MKRKKGWGVIFVIVMVIVLGMGGKKYMDSQRLREEMMAVVKSEEAKQVFEEGLKNLDPKAFTSEGIIQFYEIDYDSIKHNPMGGINVTLFVNNDKDLYVYSTLNKEEGGLIDEGGGNSVNLEKLLEAKYGE